MTELPSEFFEEELEELDPQLFGIDLNQPPLEVGESLLYKGKDPNNPERSLAIKIYPNFPFKKILEYARVTNMLANLENGKKIKIAQTGFEVRIVPVERVGNMRGHPCTVSEFIEGKTLFDEDPHYLSDRFGKFKQDPITGYGIKLREKTSYPIALLPLNVKLIRTKENNLLVITDISGAIKTFEKENDKPQVKTD